MAEANGVYDRITNFFTENEEIRKFIFFIKNVIFRKENLSTIFVDILSIITIAIVLLGKSMGLAQDQRTKQWLLSGSIGPLITILATYLYFCLYAGPKYMRNKKPFELKNTLIVYNAIQVVLSIILVVEGLEGGWRNHYNFRCQPVDYTENPIAMRMAQAVWLYYICKITELLDTVFFVLRKKQNQVSFLHLYHHTLMPICGFIGVKFFAGGHGTLLGLINSFIHAIMYLYYMLAAMGPQVQKYLWWKKYLTIMQIVQFLIVFVHTIQIQFQSDCNFPKSIGFLLTLNAGLFVYMFGSFYIRSYLRAGQKSKKNFNLTNSFDGGSHAKDEFSKSNGIDLTEDYPESNSDKSNIVTSLNKNLLDIIQNGFANKSEQSSGSNRSKSRLNEVKKDN